MDTAPVPHTEDIEDTEQGESSSKCPRKLVCSLCIGANDRVAVADLAQRVVEELQCAQYKVDTYSFSFALPPSVLLRQCAIALYHNLAVSNVQLKDTLRAALAEELSTATGLTHDQQSPFNIALDFVHPETESESHFIMKQYPKCFEVHGPKGTRITRMSLTAMQKALAVMEEEDYRAHNLWPPPGVDTPLKCARITCTHEPILIGGRYCKFSRHLSQTPWVVDGEKKMETSVQELIGKPLLQEYQVDEMKFSSSGREDADVRMLGRGRPFVVTLLNPRNPLMPADRLKEIEVSINSSSEGMITVHHLQRVNKSDFALLKEGEEHKTKEYCALIWCPERITADPLRALEGHKDVVVFQKTPVRVLHRRALATREKVVHSMCCELVDDHHFKLYLSTQAGTYIKEFVHGDFGRTRPNLRSFLGQEVDILALDVNDVVIDWPPGPSSAV